MKRIVTSFVLVVSLSLAVFAADQQPAKGRLLVATELVHGEVFAETVILLLHDDEHGAMGLVVNRPTEIRTEELLPDVDAMSGYSGPIYWGGPVKMKGVTALLRTDTPPEGADAIVESVYIVPIEEGLTDIASDAARLRFYIGYAGWGPGQLDHEMDRGDWHVVPASVEHVFAEDPRSLWQSLTPSREHKAVIY